METPLVSVCCITYNHEPYIRECLEGFVMQKTNFPFEVLVHDDASTDHTADIIREYEAKYPEIIKPIYQTVNQYSQGKHIWAEIQFPIARGKYIAFCEGDDFWTDPEKLQKQVDFLESHPKYSATFHKVKSFEQATGKWGMHNPPRFLAKGRDGFSFGMPIYTFCGWFTRTLSCVARTDILQEPLITRLSSFRDFALFYFSLKHGKGYYFNDAMGVYRIHSGGICSGASIQQTLRITSKIWKEIFLLDHSIWSFLHWQKCRYLIFKNRKKIK